jgi:hypothetical protein
MYEYLQLITTLHKTYILEWIDAKPSEKVGTVVEKLETKEHYARHTKVREATCIARLEQERRIRQP